MSMTIRYATSLLVATFFLFSCGKQTTVNLGSLSATELRVEYRVNPLGIDIVDPRLSWIVESNLRSDKQTGYQILAASSPDLLAKNTGDLWDTGKRNSSATNQIVYQGKPLTSRAQIYWKVRVWDAQNNASSWSEPAFWSMGLLKYSDWEAHWIGLNVDHFVGDKYKNLHLPPSPYLRTEFNTRSAIKRATLYASAKGLLELRLNGKPVGDDYFMPGWTDYNRRIYYATYDVTQQLKNNSANVLGAILADGWYAGYVGYALFVQDMQQAREFWGIRPALLAQLEIEYENGETQIISSISDRHRRSYPENKNVWKASLGPIIEADILMGQHYDARKELKGWDQAGYNDEEWEGVVWRSPAKGKLQAFPNVSVKALEELKPVSRTEPKPGVYVFDLGKNIAGVARLKVKGPAGTKVVLRFAEMLHQDGNIMTENLRKSRSTDTYILKGSGEEIWQPQFTYHGFQYVEVSGYPGVPGMDAVIGIRMNSDTPLVGDIRIEGDIEWGGQRGLTSQLFENIKTTQFANFFDVPTDCPQRDERMGWTGDAQVYARTASYVADVSAFFTKWVVDLRDAQSWYGAYPNFAPIPFTRVFHFAPAWMDAGIIVPYTTYQAYGDKRLLENHWDSMTRYMRFQIEAAGDDLLRPGGGHNFGDWLAVGHQTDKDYIASAYFAYGAKLMAAMAHDLNKHKEEIFYTKLFKDIKTAFVNKYIDDQGRINEHSQTAYGMALAMGLYPAELEANGAEQLATLVKENNNKLSTGFLGVRHLLPMLSKYGYHDLAYALLTQTEYPSWGYEVVNGATSIWERWNSFTVKDGFMDPQMNSFSHYAYGSVGEWMFSDMAGIESTTPGYGTIRIRPRIKAAPFKGVAASHKSIRGLIKSHWRKVNNDILLSVTVPANVTAEVIVPATSLSSVLEGEVQASKTEGIIKSVYHNGYASFKVGGGNYEFKSRGALTKP